LLPPIANRLKTTNQKLNETTTTKLPYFTEYTAFGQFRIDFRVIFTADYFEHTVIHNVHLFSDITLNYRIPVSHLNM
jgi:hypothetical protein